jgi:large subunit ribosomal protein L25
MEQIVVKASHRAVIGKQVRALRRAGKLPAILYGSGIEPTPISLDMHEASHSLAHLPSSALITLELDGQPHLALVREKQRDFIKGNLKHIDFQAVSMMEKLRVAVSVQTVGESSAVKDFNGVLVTGLEEVEVECFPQDLPESIIVDLSSLKKIGDGIYIRDIVPPKNVVILESPGEMIVLVTAQAAEEVEAVVAEEVVEEGAEPEVIEKGKKEEEEEEE